MRFLLGLLVGAALTFAIATVVERPRDQVIADARAIWHALHEHATSLINAGSERDPPSAIESVSLLTEFNAPIEETTEAPPVFEPIPMLDPEPEVPVTADPFIAQTGTAPVWTAFHSERSASGFAETLSRELGHAFTIDKQGAGKYQVVFAYASESERTRLLNEIDSIIGVR